MAGGKVGESSPSLRRKSIQSGGGVEPDHRIVSSLDWLSYCCKFWAFRRWAVRPLPRTRCSRTAGRGQLKRENFSVQANGE
jgi:hypothetical protein